MAIQILIADDNPIVRGALRQVLETEGQGLWQIFDAENGQDAISLAQQIRPSLVILDLAMPLKDGLRTAREISQILPGTPIVLHTLYWSHRVVIEAMKAGIRKTVPKSESAVLVAAVRELLEETAPRAEPGEQLQKPHAFPSLPEPASVGADAPPADEPEEVPENKKPSQDEPGGVQNRPC